MKKIINVKLAILLAFVLASGIFSVSGSVYAQGNGDDDDNNDNDVNSENVDINVNPLTGTNDSAEEVEANFTEFVNATTPEDVSEQAANITGSSSPPGELDYASSDNTTSANSTNPTANATNTTTIQ
jgi:cytoskeletal protein RodZ